MAATGSLLEGYQDRGKEGQLAPKKRGGGFHHRRHRVGLHSLVLSRDCGCDVAETDRLRAEIAKDDDSHRQGHVAELVRGPYLLGIREQGKRKVSSRKFFPGYVLIKK